MSRVISREDVHAYSEACSDMGMGFQSIATRLVKEQNRLKTFIDKEFVQVDPLAGQVALYMFTVCLRVFEQDGGKLKKSKWWRYQYRFCKNTTAFKESLLPLDDDFSERAKGESNGVHNRIFWMKFYGLSLIEVKKIKRRRSTFGYQAISIDLSDAVDNCRGS